MEYIMTAALAAFQTLIVARLERGLGSVILLEGPPGGGKTSFSKALAAELGGQLFYYSGSPDRERDLLYEIDVQGVLERERAWVPGPAWQAFAAAAAGEKAVLLIDEIDKTHPGFDAFLLRLLEEWTFRAPDGSEVRADPANLAVVITTNGRRALRPEVSRRCQRIRVPLPKGERLREIVRQLAGIPVEDRLLDLVIRLGEAVRTKDGDDLAPSPKELANLVVDLRQLVEDGCYDDEVWRQVAASWLVKDGGPEKLDRVTKYAWTKALMTESRRRG